MVDWTLYSKQMTVGGDAFYSRSDKFASILKGGGLEGHPNVESVVLGGEAVDVLIVSTKDEFKKTFINRIVEKVPKGTIFEVSGTQWMLCDILRDKAFDTRGYIYKCNKTITWQNTLGQIVSTPSYVTNKGTGTSMSNTQHMSLYNSKYIVEIPFTPDTVNIKVGQRFIVDVLNGVPLVYEVVFINTGNICEGEDGGTIVLDVDKAEFNPATDNLELRVCDYVEPIAVLEEECRSSISGASTVKSGGSLRRYSPSFIDSGIEVGGVEPVWNIEIPEGIEEYILISYDGDDLFIKAENKGVVIGKKIKITLSESSGTFKPTNKEVLVVSIVG